MRNPFAPGAGIRPPELAGREDIIDAARVVLGRVIRGRAAKGLMMLGLRGVGKTVLLNHLAGLADEAGFETIELEAPEDGCLAERLVPLLRSVLIRLSRVEKARDLSTEALAVLRSFAAAFTVRVGDVEFGVAAAPGRADSGHLDLDLPELLMAVSLAARKADRGFALLIDEVQYLGEDDLGALIVASHKLAQKQLPYVFFGAGLPQLAGLAGEAKSYSERLFDYPEVGSLPEDEATNAIERPIGREGEVIEAAAVKAIIDTTHGYPYFLQEWGFRTWHRAAASPITLEDVQGATSEAIEALDSSFFRVRLDRLTPREQEYLRAMAELGEGPHRSGDVAKALGVKVTSVAPIRSNLIRKGMVYSPKYGDTAFTVPMFDDFMRRTMPDWSPPKRARRGRRKPK